MYAGFFRREAPNTFIPAFPSFALVEIWRKDGNVIDFSEAENLVTTDDLVPPEFFSCPPSLEERTFTATSGEVLVTVFMPTMAAFDNVDPSPKIEYPFYSANLSVIGECWNMLYSYINTMLKINWLTWLIGFPYCFTLNTSLETVAIQILVSTNFLLYH